MTGRIERSWTHASPRRIGRIAAMATALPLFAGCYSFTPIPVDPAPVGQNVRVYVTRTGAPEVLSVTESVGVIPEIRGQVTGVEDGSLLLRMPIRPEPGTGAGLADIAQLVRVPTDEIVALELQEFSPARTAFLVAGGAALAAAIVFVIIDASGQDGPTDPPDPPLLMRRMPILRIPIG